MIYREHLMLCPQCYFKLTNTFLKLPSSFEDNYVIGKVFEPIIKALNNKFPESKTEKVRL